MAAIAATPARWRTCRAPPRSVATRDCRSPAAKSAIVVGDELRRTRAVGSRRALRARRRLPRRDARAPARSCIAGSTSIVGRDVAGKAYVDTGPMLERDLARRAGLGWFGKNTMLINPRAGRSSFSARCWSTSSSSPTRRSRRDHCGTCRRCSTRVRRARSSTTRVLDANRCISYLTIELKGEIPAEWHAAIGELIYGCDICQDVCPWNEKFSLPLREDAFRPRARRSRGRMRGRSRARSSR